jgi:WD40 repeat protein
MKIDHHRGPVTAVKISSASNVLVSSSVDATICLWHMETYELLNIMQLSSPIINFHISADSVFVLAHCEDNNLYLRTLATGTELHLLKGHKSKIRAFCLAWDSQRAIVGCEDTRALIFDMCSGKIIRSMPPNPGAVTAVYVMDKDDYLITAGGNKLTFYSFRNEDSIVNYYPKKKEKRKHRKQLMSSNRLNLNSNNSPICCFDISRDSTMAVIATHRTIQVWLLNVPELSKTFEGHSGIISCISFAPNGEFIASGSDDKTVLVWGLQFGILTTTFKCHNSSISSIIFLMDSRRIVSADRDGLSHVWLAETGTILQTIQGPHKSLAVTNNMKFAVSIYYIAKCLFFPFGIGSV